MPSRELFKKTLDDLVPHKNGIQFSGEDFRLLLGPIIYLLLWQGHVIYVGMSKRGISRVTAGRHTQAQDERGECDEVWVFPTETVKAARELERLLITALNPTQNRNGRHALLTNLMGYARSPRIYKRPNLSTPC